MRPAWFASHAAPSRARNCAASSPSAAAIADGLLKNVPSCSGDDDRCGGCGRVSRALDVVWSQWRHKITVTGRLRVGERPGVCFDAIDDLGARARRRGRRTPPAPRGMMMWRPSGGCAGGARMRSRPAHAGHTVRRSPRERRKRQRGRPGGGGGCRCRRSHGRCCKRRRAGFRAPASPGRERQFCGHNGGLYGERNVPNVAEVSWRARGGASLGRRSRAHTVPPCRGSRVDYCAPAAACRRRRPQALAEARGLVPRRDDRAGATAAAMSTARVEWRCAPP